MLEHTGQQRHQTRVGEHGIGTVSVNGPGEKSRQFGQHGLHERGGNRVIPETGQVLEQRGQPQHRLQPLRVILRQTKIDKALLQQQTQRARRIRRRQQPGGGEEEDGGLVGRHSTAHLLQPQRGEHLAVGGHKVLNDRGEGLVLRGGEQSGHGSALLLGDARLERGGRLRVGQQQRQQLRHGV